MILNNQYIKYFSGVPDSPTVENAKLAVTPLQSATTSPKDGPALPKPPPQRKAKYKMIQPRLQPCDIATYNASQHALAPTRSQLVQQQDEQGCNNVNSECCIQFRFSVLFNCVA